MSASSKKGKQQPLDYCIVRINNVIVMSMSVDAATLTKDALEIIAPDADDMAGLAVKMAEGLTAAIEAKG
jgi:hypothetical protein